MNLCFKPTLLLSVAAALSLSCLHTRCADAFLSSQHTFHTAPAAARRHPRSSSRLFYSWQEHYEFQQQEVASMETEEVQQLLEIYGISTKAELMAVLHKARQSNPSSAAAADARTQEQMLKQQQELEAFQALQMELQRQEQLKLELQKQERIKLELQTFLEHRLDYEESLLAAERQQQSDRGSSTSASAAPNSFRAVDEEDEFEHDYAEVDILTEEEMERLQEHQRRGRATGADSQHQQQRHAAPQWNEEGYEQYADVWSDDTSGYSSSSSGPQKQKWWQEGVNWGPGWHGYTGMASRRR